MDDQAGTIRISYEYQSLRSNNWYRVSASDDKDETIATAIHNLDSGTIDGVRVVKLRHYVDHDFTDTVIVFKQIMPGINEGDPQAPAVETEAEASWTEPAHLYAERGRAELRTHLVKYLEENKITALELLHSDQHMTVLDGAGTHLQGLLQKMAVEMARSSKATSAELFKNLLALSATVLQQIRADAERLPAPKLAPGLLSRLFKAFEAHFSGPTLVYHLYRALAAYLLDAGSWREKLDRAGQLIEPEMDIRLVRILDLLFFEMLSLSGPYRDILPENADRVTTIRTLTDFYAGRYASAGGETPPGLIALTRAVGYGLLPRTRAILRRRVLGEIHFRQPLLSGGELLRELEAQAEVQRYVTAATADLAADEEFAQAFDMRYGRAITPETMSRLMATQNRIVDKIREVAKVFQATPGENNRANIGKYFRALVTPEDVVRQAVRDGGNRINAIPPLVELWAVLAASPVDQQTRIDVVSAVDAALLDIFRTDILNAPNRTYMDRIVTMIRTATQPMLPDGKAKLFVAEIVGKELKNPKLMPAYVGKLRSEQERSEAIAKLKTLIFTSGVVLR